MYQYLKFSKQNCQTPNHELGSIRSVIIHFLFLFILDGVGLRFVGMGYLIRVIYVS
jgi:hypothetical protein